MDLIIKPKLLSGCIDAPPSKSAAHRAIICAALAQGKSTVLPLAMSEDALATIDVAKALGAVIKINGNTAEIWGICKPAQAALLDCRESGSTLRFFLPVASALGVNATFTGKGKLPQRTVAPLAEQMQRHGAAFTCIDSLPLSISGRLSSGRYELAGNISSQYISGLLFALPMLEGDSEIALTTKLESAGYVKMTMQALQGFGVKIEEMPAGYFIKGNQKYIANTAKVEGDYSNAAFWLSAAALGSDISCTGLDENSLQGDKAVLDILKAFGASIASTENGIAAKAQKLTATDIDASQIPDLVPVLAVVGAFAQGTTTIYNAARLKLKESDRLASVSNALKSLGADITKYDDKLVIAGKPSLKGGVIDSCNDHRIAMSMAIAATRCDGNVTILGAECVNKSYPDFFEKYKSLGGIYQCHHV
ncbi:MAG TPA: 3-phosphoshikimate 1-carboxyvinyltransferase [Ruminococcaceae bacterium]|nr:3-phosphoshikimate 1-carboxyvinyltransferase [Oscillospiraceae bacterium]